jgi:hypothetical protein
VIYNDNNSSSIDNNTNNNNNSDDNNSSFDIRFIRNWVLLFFIYGISNLIARIKGLKLVFDSTSSFMFYFIIF